MRDVFDGARRSGAAADAGSEPADATAWLADIEAAERSLADWHKRCDKIRRRYRADASQTKRQSQYQMLWANIETLKPAVFARLPQAICSRRYRDSDPVGRVAGEMLERAVNFTLETSDYETRFRQVAADLVMYARGTARLRYEPVTLLVENDDPLDVAAMQGPVAAFADEASAPADPIEVLDFEHVRLDFVAHEDFIHPPARVWEELPWIAFRVFLTRDELCRRFGSDIGGSIALDAGPELGGEPSDRGAIQKATLYEVWDKTTRTVLWLAKGHDTLLESGDPYLKLEGFFPCPRPAYGTMTSDSLEPVPDYVYYQDQAEEINKLTARIDALADSLKLVGFYPGGPQGEGAPEIERAVRPGFENRLIAVKSWAAFTEGGKGAAPIVWLPIEMVADIIEKCVDLRKQLISDVWELTGVSDIMRGQGDSDETATGVNAKSRFGMSRLSQRQAEMARFARDIARMVAEILCDQFQPETLMAMSNIMLPTQQDVLAAAIPAAGQNLGAPAAGQTFGEPAAGQNFGAPAAGQNLGAPAAGQIAGLPAADPMAAGPLSDATAGGIGPAAAPLPPPPPAPQAGAQAGPTVEQVFGLLRDGVMRRFRIDIETDSTIASDETKDRADRTAFIGAVSQFVEGWAPLLMQAPMLAPLAGALLTFGARGFRIGRDLEDRIEEAADRLTAMASAPKPPPPPPEPADQIKLAVAQIKGRAELQKSQMDIEAAAQQHQSRIVASQLDVDRAILDHQQAIERHQMALQAQAASMQTQAAPLRAQTVPSQAQAAPPQADLPSWAGVPPADPPPADPPSAVASAGFPSSAPPPGLPGDPNAAMAPMPGAFLARDGRWYVASPWTPGKHLRIDLP